MAYQFNATKDASAIIHHPNTDDKLKLAGINGMQTNANNFQAAISGLMQVVGLQMSDLERNITQEVEEAP